MRERGISLRRFSYGFVVVILLGWLSIRVPEFIKERSGFAPGDVIDRYQQVPVYYNGRIGHTAGRHLSADGYNLGLKWQATEFVKRFYYETYDHRMPDSYGYPKDFFDPRLADGAFNEQRGLSQYKLPGEGHPLPGDILVWGSSERGRRGHVAIVTKSPPEAIEYIQQNAGRTAPTRVWVGTVRKDGQWHLDDTGIRGFLRKS